MSDEIYKQSDSENPDRQDSFSREILAEETRVFLNSQPLFRLLETVAKYKPLLSSFAKADSYLENVLEEVIQALYEINSAYSQVISEGYINPKAVESAEDLRRELDQLFGNFRSIQSNLDKALRCYPNMRKEIINIRDTLGRLQGRLNIN